MMVMVQIQIHKIILQGLSIMYCIKVTEGRERIEIRKYSSAFLPSCVTAESQKAGARPVRRFVVPGYIFTIRKESKAILVPPEEWRVIEALADSHPSFIDEEGNIVSGPLAALADCIAAAKDDRVKVQAVLLGEKRAYWIPVRSAAELSAPPPEEEKPEVKPPVKKDKGEKNMEYTQEQISRILADAASVGAHAASKNAGVPWQTILRWAREAGTELPSRSVVKPAGRRGRKSAAKPEGADADLSPLELENAALREKVAQLEAKVKKLQKAIEQLM